MLAGSEVKSIRDGKVTLLDAFAEIRTTARPGCTRWTSASTPSPTPATTSPRRKRKLLLHRAEIDRLIGKVREKGYTMVPLSLYEKDGRVKVELGLAHGKQQHDRRQDTRKREAQREIDRAMSARRR